MTKCFNCGKEEETNKMHYWYHGDQDDLICEQCAKETEHTDTAYYGMKVLK